MIVIRSLDRPFSSNHTFTYLQFITSRCLIIFVSTALIIQFYLQRNPFGPCSSAVFPLIGLQKLARFCNPIKGTMETDES